MDLAGCCLNSIKTLIGNYQWSSLALSTAVFTAIALHFYYKNLYSYWESRGIKGPKPWPIIGNLYEILVSNRMLLERDWRQKYGKVYGVYHGMKPRLIVADPDILRQICVKDFDVFPNHAPLEFGNKYQRHFIFFEQDEHWKRVRAMLTPTFTSVKIKRMYRLLDVCADDLLECFMEHGLRRHDNEEGAIVNVKNVFSFYTMDAIASCCYGLKLERSGSCDLKGAASRNEFVAIGMKIFDTDLRRILMAFTLPRPLLKFIGFEASSIKRMEPLAQRVEKLISLRRKSNRKFDDYLQILLDAKFDDELSLNEMDQHENHHAGLTEQSLVQDQKQLVDDVHTSNGSVLSSINKIELNDMEILSNAIFLLMVGLETTATLLTHCVYSLAFYPECQAKLYDEISKIARTPDKGGQDSNSDSKTFDYEKLTSCLYLDAVISETLRILSPVIQLDRVSNSDYKIEKYNLSLPSGTKLNLAYYAVMNDPDYWPDPDRFDPERFMPGNKEKIYPGSYCPFGIGPRHCLGMRFSLTESKLALAKVLMQLRFEPAPGTKFPPEPKLNFALNGLKNPTVRVIKRT